MTKRSKAVFALGFVFLVFSKNVASMDEVETHHILAAILIKVTHFIQWPEKETKRNNVKLCFFGANKFGDSISNAAEKHPYIVYPVKIFDVLLDVEGQCDILFIDGSKKSEFEQVFRKLQDKPILTVSDIVGFEHSGGIMELGVSDNRLSISINIESAKKAGLKIDSQLLFLSKGSSRGGGP